MARHYIYPRPVTEGAVQDQRLELHWQRDSGVQIASTKWAGSAGTAPDTAAEYLDDTSMEPLRAWAGQFLDLNRDQINHLIKQLRAARDQAFGKDE